MGTVQILIEYCDFQTNLWYQSILQHAELPFASGGLRQAYFANFINSQGLFSSNDGMVLKIPFNNLMDEVSARNQVMMQARCQEYSNKYNSIEGVVKRVEYVQSHLLKFLTGRWAGFYATIEKYIDGSYEKHNTVNPKLDGVALTPRNTPQAFSHFTFEVSGKTEIVVDVQGVGDIYTDPQLYSIDKRYGPADYGIVGISNFFKNHKCNAVCMALGLQQIIPVCISFGLDPILSVQIGLGQYPIISFCIGLGIDPITSLRIGQGQHLVISNFISQGFDLGTSIYMFLSLEQSKSMIVNTGITCVPQSRLPANILSIAQ